MTDRLLDTDEVEKLGPWSKATWAYWRHINYGPPYALIGKRVVYKESEVVAWIETKFKEKESA